MSRKWLWLLLAVLFAGGLAMALNPNRLAKPLPSAIADEAAQPGTPVAGTGRVDSRGVEQVWVPPGCFRRGADPARERANWYETPQHDVCLTRGFWVDKYEVTNAAFKEFVDQKGYLDSNYWSEEGWKWKGNAIAPDPAPVEFSGARQPRNWVTAYEADAYARWRGGQLPTEAQWEYAARGPKATIYPWGDRWDVGRANVGESGHAKTVAVDGYANGVSWSGAFHMAGNVREWTSDSYVEGLYREHVLRDPVGPRSAPERAVRGGSYASTGTRFLWFDFPPDSARAARRSSVVPTHRSVALGMRVVSFD